MEFFKSLWKPRGNIAIPQYTPEDSADLLVKSLMYMFKRLDLTAPQNVIARNDVDGMSKDEMLRLDQMYNITQFEAKLQDDPHRVLVDWQKNKFRAMLILAHLPQLESLPKFDIPNYRFVVLESDASNDEYIRTLSTSDIYIEHSLPIQVRREIAATCLRKYRDRNLQTRDQIIKDYLRLVATEIQVARIYKAMLNKVKTPPNQQGAQGSQGSQNAQSSPAAFKAQQSRFPSRSRSPSPVRTRTGKPETSGKLGPAPNLSAGNQTSAFRTQNSPRSSQRSSPQSSPHSSPQSSPRPSHDNFNTENAHPLRKPASSSRLNGMPNLNVPPNGGFAPSIDANKKYILQQARFAVKGRIEKEQRIMNAQS